MKFARDRSDSPDAKLDLCVGTTSDDQSMAGIKVVILEDACASQSFGEFSAQQAHDFALARFRYLFGQTLTTGEFRDIAEGRTEQR